MAGTWNLADLFEAVVDRVGEREAVVSPATRLSYADLDERANRLAHVLAAHGVARGDRVGLALRNGHEHLESLLGAYKLGAVPFNVNYRYTAAEMAYLFADARPRVVLHGPDLGEAVEPAVAERRAAGDAVTPLVGRGAPHEERLAGADPARPDGAGRRGDDLYLLYTGGTTGMPKGVEWRHQDIVVAAMGAGSGAMVDAGRAPRRPATPAAMVQQAAAGRSRCLPASPLIHGTAQWVALATLLAGGTVLTIPDSTFDPAQLWDHAAAEAATLVVIVGDAFGRPLADALAAHPDRWELGALVAVVSGGAVLSPAVRDELSAHLPWAAIVDGYGTSETGGQGNAVWWPGRPAAERTRFPLGDHTAVLDHEGSPLVPGIDTGRIGLIARRGHIPLGYRNDPVRTAQTFPVLDGVRWAVPGDLGRVEDDGTVTLLGRGASSINTGGEKVFPDEVEAVLKAHPTVFDAAVVGVPDERWGERVTAVVAPRAGATLDRADLEAHCRDHLAAFKVPRRLVEVAAVRRLPSGKADHAWVRAVARTGPAPRDEAPTGS
ncbi:MAG TPA: AMP-binding protein [Acidimicrobiales bacterium]|nr:AMP-binding protein [Acidimicrobiales bacterium]